MKKAKWVVMLLTVALVVGLAGLVAVSCGGTAESATAEGPTTTDSMENYSFVFSLGMPSMASLYNTYFLPWTKTVEASSGGRVTFDMKPGNTLVKQDQQVDALLSGTSDITAFQPSWVPGAYPLLELAAMPALFPNTQVAARVMGSIIEEYGKDQFPGMKVLGFLSISPNQYGGTKPVEKLEDFKGMRIRSGGGVETDIVKALGGTPSEFTSGDLQTDLKGNEFDGLMLSWSFHAGNTNNWCTYWTECNLFMGPLLLVMNQEKWDSLPAAVQKSFSDNSSTDVSVKYLAFDAAFNYDNKLVPGAKVDVKQLDYLAVKAQADKVGHPIYVLSEEEKARWAAALEPVRQKWVSSYADKLPTQEIMERAKALSTQYSAEMAAAAAEGAVPATGGTQ
jgi:TRAP-type C4-dicarboxylate transport system substrate-binding protein